MSSSTEGKKSPQLSPLDYFYQNCCPGCKMEAHECQRGSTTETNCLLAHLADRILILAQKIGGT